MCKFTLKQSGRIKVFLSAPWLGFVRDGVYCRRNNKELLPPTFVCNFYIISYIYFFFICPTIFQQGCCETNKKDQNIIKKKSWGNLSFYSYMRVLEFCARFNKNAGAYKKLRLAHKKN